jgi:TetR/AcrR family transcriptional regulator
VRSKSSVQEARMLDAAAKLFGAQRFHEVRMEDIASQAVVGKGTLYRYFKDKDELYDALLERAAQQFLGRLSDASTRAHLPRERLEALVHAIITFFDEQPHLFDLIQRSEVLVRPGGVFPWQKMRDDLNQVIREVFEQGQAAGEFSILDPELMVLMLLGGLRSVIRFGVRPRATDLAHRVVTRFLEGAQISLNPDSKSR